MKNKLLSLAANICSKGRAHNDPELERYGDQLAEYASSLAEESVSSEETTSNEENENDGGIEVPKKPPPP